MRLAEEDVPRALDKVMPYKRSNERARDTDSRISVDDVIAE
jgi:hypothetical protein